MVLEVKEDALYDTKDMAEVLGVNVRTVRRWCREGRLPAFKLGSRKWRCWGRDLLKLGLSEKDLDTSDVPF